MWIPNLVSFILSLMPYSKGKDERSGIANFDIDDEAGRSHGFAGSVRLVMVAALALYLASLGNLISVFTTDS